ncbi:MAG: ComEC/Rec2 family competence protein [Patescibacteria group bacterium]|nr:ComEC/Rec2 family competence protein [Patescibacteria group bacterium]
MNRFRILIIALILILILRFFTFYQQQNSFKNGQEISFETTLFSEPQFIGNYQKFTAALSTGENVFITAPLNPQYGYGDKLRISGTLEVGVIKDKKIYVMHSPKIEAVKTDKNPILAVIAFIRQSVTALFNNNLPPDLSSLLLGIVFGIKAPMSANFLGSLRTAGVMHVIAASGMNITMVAGFLSSIFMLFLKRQTALLASILGIVFYAFLAGMQPSIIRAAIMGILVFSSQILGRQSLGAYGLFLAAFMMLFISPGLVSDVGFQLSFAATAGLLYLNPLFNRVEKFNSLIKRFPLSENLFITFSAQLATLPILLATFGTYSLWSIPANALVLWTVPILMILGGAGAILGMIFEPLGSMLAYLSLPLLLYFQKIVIFFGALGGVLTIQNLPLTFILGYYLLVFAFVFYFSKPKKD